MCSSYARAIIRIKCYARIEYEADCPPHSKPQGLLVYPLDVDDLQFIHGFWYTSDFNSSKASLNTYTGGASFTLLVYSMDLLRTVEIWLGTRARKLFFLYSVRRQLHRNSRPQTLSVYCQY